MKATNRIQILGSFDRLFSTASDIARWPEILPHYRWVKILERMGSDIRAEMAARHRGVPLWWRTILRPRPVEKRIYFTHIGGITKGMEVYWSFTPLTPSPAPAGDDEKETWFVEIHHEFNPSWPPPGKWFAEKVIGQKFVQEVANKTLTRMKDVIESGT